MINSDKIRDPKKNLYKSLTYKGLQFYSVDPLGLEPRTTGPKPAVLPITPWVNHAKKRRKFITKK